MDKYALPVVVVLGIGAYLLIGEQFKKLREAPAPQIQVNPAVIPSGPVIPAFQPIPPINFNNPFAKQGPPPEPAADDFTSVAFEAPNKMFRATFPGRKPTQETVLIKATRYSVPKPGTMFEINEYDSGWRAAKRPGTAREWLQKCHQDQLTGMHAREESATSLLVAARYPGIEFEALYFKDDKAQAWFGRVYLIDSQLYTASVYGDPAVVNFRAIPFLDSFKFTSKVTGQPDPDPKVD